ncbi:MAG: IclR family transcriptional regulator [Anaerolineae bacterium]|nr:IclR family transcriptional regulator [Anaerolineae bacterium]
MTAAGAVAERRKSDVQSLSRAIAILHAFNHQNPELGVTEISKLVGLHKSTTFRLLSTLISEGLVTQDPESGRYRLGLGMLELAGRVQVHAEVRQAARPFMQPLAQRLGATANIAILDRGTSFNIEQAVPTGYLVINYGWVGRRTPLHATSTGKILLAWLPAAEIRAVLSEPLERYTPDTITSMALLEQELERVRAAGYAVGREEYEVGLNAIAAPLRDATSSVIAALSVSAPAYRLAAASFETVAGELVAAATAISRQLGYVP